ncbi:MAG: sodium:solute symporter family protein [Planctomycetaceae bacterium]|nr:sodium:solute symporter family protein [Planctomycetaceae bacterium]
MAAGIWVRKYVGKVEHFLVAGREMDVFLGIASLAATEFGIVTCMYTAEAGYKYGFAGATPGICQAIALFVIGVTGFCIKPLRDSGVFTIPELLERRFGPRVRWASGLVIVLGGLLNMGVFLRIGGEFLILVAGLGGDTFPLEWMMTVLLVMVAVYTILGGMLSVLVTDFLQFVVMSVGLIAVTLLILFQIGWSELAATVHAKHGPGGFNPFIHAELGWPYVLFQMCVTTAATLTWQTSIARVLAAKDTQTGRQIYTRTSFFFVCRFLIPGIWGIAALAILAPEATPSNALHAMPTFLSQFVPVGLMGLLIAAMLAADMSTDSSYMLTWSSVIYNDLLAPWHRGRWNDRVGLLCNRLIVAAIGLFLLVYGLWYPLEGNVWDYLAVTGTIYLASMSTLLIACCYWQQANDWGAFAAIITGATIPSAYLVAQHFAATQTWAKQVGPYYSGIAAYALTAVAMVVGSLLKYFFRPRLTEVA